MCNALNIFKEYKLWETELDEMENVRKYNVYEERKTRHPRKESQISRIG